MSDTLFLRFHEAIEGEADEVEWGVLAGEALDFVARGVDVSVSDILEEARGQLDRAGWLPDEVVMVLPASAMFITEVTINARRRSQILRALPFVVEEHLADDIDQMHLAPGAVEAHRPIPVAAIDRRMLRSWVERVSEADLVADAAVPDALLIPPPLAGDAVIHLDGDDALLRWGDTHASRVQSDLLPKMATLIAAELEDDEPLGVTIVYDEDRNDELAQARLGSELQEIRPVDVRFETQTVDLFQRLCKRYRSAPQSINLLQGEFQPVRRRGEAPLARLAWAAVLLVAWIAVDLGINVTQAILLDRETDRLETEAVALYRSWFPGDRRVTTLNIRDRTMAHIKTGAAQTAEDEFFVLLSALARELSSRRGANVQSINYSESAGQLTLELSADGYSTVEGITNALQANGVNVEIASARQEEERVLANLRLQRG